ncbi:trypco2 family protein [Streptomyces sp. NPDC058954]|uniref:trypco2 family protein n=1 Tax=Streptomyces sp. NPDC058954 TaxID=3346677 RepID=UPI003693C104
MPLKYVQSRAVCPAELGDAVDDKDDVANALDDLRRQLYQAQDAGVGQQFQFEVEKAELHLEVQIRKDATGKAKLSIGAAAVEAGGAAGQTRSHRLVLTLNVRDNAVDDRVRIRQEERTPWSEIGRHPHTAGDSRTKQAPTGRTNENPETPPDPRGGIDRPGHARRA